MAQSARERLLDTAERLFYEEGFHATGINRVVHTAGVARMTLYNHFDSKEALVIAVLERRHRRYCAELQTAVDAARGPALLALVEAHCVWLASLSDEGCMLVKAMGEFGRHQASVFERARGFKRELVTLIRTAAERDGLPGAEALAERVFLVLEGTNQMVPVLGPERTREHGTALTRALLPGPAAAP